MIHTNKDDDHFECRDAWATVSHEIATSLAHYVASFYLIHHGKLESGVFLLRAWLWLTI